MSRIALVDDDRNILTSVAMTLEAEGFEVDTYSDGQQAFDAFSKKLPDMAVLDVKMPRMDGMDLLQRLRQKTSMPVIFLTSKDDEIDEVLGLRMIMSRNRFRSGFWWSGFARFCAGRRPMLAVWWPRRKSTRCSSEGTCGWTRCATR